MTKQEATQRGQQHAASGKKNTPNDCRDFDNELFALCKTANRPARLYAQLRSAFNKGWHVQYFKQVSE